MAEHEMSLLTDEQLDALVVDFKTRPREPKLREDELVRYFRGWTIDKLAVLRLYFKLYRRVAGGGTYLDAFAGDGHCRTRDPISGDDRDGPGSALVALQSGA